MSEAPEGIGTPTPLNNYYVTFGMMYRYERHPYWMWAHPDGWLRVMAPDEEAARDLLRRCIGTRYAFIYEEGRFNTNGFTLEEIAMISTDGTSSVSRRIDNGNGYPPQTRFDESSPEWYGHDAAEVVAARIQGKAVPDGDADAGGFDDVGYDAVTVHKRCFVEAVSLFEDVDEVDLHVQAGELDWNSPVHCVVCEISIT